MSRYRADRV